MSQKKYILIARGGVSHLSGRIGKACERKTFGDKNGRNEEKDKIKMSTRPWMRTEQERWSKPYIIQENIAISRERTQSSKRWEWRKWKWCRCHCVRLWAFYILFSLYLSLRNDEKIEPTNNKKESSSELQAQYMRITWKTNKEYMYSGFSWMTEHPTNIKDYTSNHSKWSAEPTFTNRCIFFSFSFLHADFFISTIVENWENRSNI